jgi:hypothetical protein
VGYFDENRLISTTVRDQLNEYGDSASGQDGARLIGYHDSINIADTNVGDQLDLITGITDGLPDKLQNGFAVYGDDIGAPDVLTVNIIPSYVAYVPGTKVFVKVGNNNATQTPTLNLNALGAQNIIANDGQPVEPNTLKANGVYQFVYDGTNFQLLQTPIREGIFSQTDIKTVTNTSAEVSAFGTLVGSTTFDPNQLVPGSFYRYLLKTDIVKGTVTGTFFVRFKVNGVTIMTEELYLGGSIQGLRNFDIIFELAVKSIGNPSTVDLWGQLVRYDTGLNVKNADIVEKYVTDNTNIDSTVSNTVDITVEFTQGDIANTFRSIAATVTRLY